MFIFFDMQKMCICPGHIIYVFRRFSRQAATISLKCYSVGLQKGLCPRYGGHWSSEYYAVMVIRLPLEITPSTIKHNNRKCASLLLFSTALTRRKSGRSLETFQQSDSLSPFRRKNLSLHQWLSFLTCFSTIPSYVHSHSLMLQKVRPYTYTKRDKSKTLKRLWKGHWQSEKLTRKIWGFYSFLDENHSPLIHDVMLTGTNRATNSSILWCSRTSTGFKSQTVLWHDCKFSSRSTFLGTWSAH